MFSEGDLTARAVIRDRALELFAERGPDAVTVREIAAAAGVSAGLVVHHYGSKQALRVAVDDHVTGLFEAMVAGAATDPAVLAGGGRAAGGFADLFLTYLPAGSPVPAYLRRLLASGDEAGRVLFRRWFTLTVAMVEEWTAAGILRPSDDPPARAAFLLVNDLAVVLLRDHLAEALGIDPMTDEGMRRWAANAVAAYTQGVFTAEEDR